MAGTDASEAAGAPRFVNPPRNLFAPPPPPPPAPPPPTPRNTLFGIVTGARWRAPANPAPEPAPRAEPSLHGHAEPVPSVGLAQPEEMGLDIPTFLRRQSS
jgi:cell division protein FtsZ